MDHSLMSPTWGDHEHHSKDPLVLEVFCLLALTPSGL